MHRNKSFKDDQDNTNPIVLTKEYFDLRGRDHMYRMLVEKMNEGALVVNNHLMIVYSNQRFAEITGVELQKVIGASLEQFVKSTDFDKLSIFCSNSMERTLTFEIDLKLQSKKYLPVVMSVSSTNIDSNSYFGIIVNDISFQKKIEAQLEARVKERTEELASANQKLNKSNRKLSDINNYLDSFVHTVAHDLRSPVANLKLVQQMLDIANEQEKPKLLNSIFDNIRVLDNTLQGLVQIIESQGKKELSTPGIDIHLILKKVISEKQLNIKQSNANIHIVCKTNEKINYVEEYIKSIARNMISNALKFAKPGRSLVLEIEIDRNPEYFILSFKDNGIGIDLNRMGDKLFKPFQQISSNADGLGIGLHIIDNMVRKNGGYIDVESQPGAGTKFTVYLKEYITK